jgi:hypothetical protein
VSCSPYIPPSSLKSAFSTGLLHVYKLSDTYINGRLCWLD